MQLWHGGALAGAASGFLYAACFPGRGAAEAAYLFAVPLLCWFFFRPSWKTVLTAAFISGYAAWLFLISWLRHVTWAGTLFLAFYISLYWLGWMAAARALVPRMAEWPARKRLWGHLGLAGWWVVLEWLRSFLFSGFPWLPLAASQWRRPLLLQTASWTGAYGVSFLLILFNLALAFYMRRLAARAAGKRGRIQPELYAALLLLLGAGAWGYRSLSPTPEELFRAGFVQPYIPQSLKWDAAEARQNLEVLAAHSRFAKEMGAEIILWPESATPWPVSGDKDMQAWTEKLAAELGLPILMGNMARTEDETYYNGIFTVTPEGLREAFYAKRRLVPFGEYVPFSEQLPFIQKFVPIEGAFTPGESAEPLSLPVGKNACRAGGLVCYEDIFPALTRDSVRAGAELLFVATNNAWYGEEAGACQHAAHSVLRAVENRRPVLRCGNGGWSGWIDESGRVRRVLTVPGKGIYFRGVETALIKRAPAWKDRLTFYTRHGDWFVCGCGLLAAAGAWLARCSDPRPP